MNNDIYWFRVLEHFGKKRYFQNGLTLPFLIGSRIVVEPGKSLLSIEEIIISFNNLSNPPITVMKCGDIGEYVFGIMDFETNTIRKGYQNLYKEFGNLIDTDWCLFDCENVGQVIKKFVGVYNEHIQLENYSKNDGSWGRFSKTDLQHLQELL